MSGYLNLYASTSENKIPVLHTDICQDWLDCPDWDMPENKDRDKTRRIAMPKRVIIRTNLQSAPAYDRYKVCLIYSDKRLNRVYESVSRFSVERIKETGVELDIWIY